ncbi:hypothetical protein PC9H_010364 [Pleurotus ostreatus]|uniref:Uncharacterized protein n=1 Tax=Pleurotus ostreatus TaxID=5322 RepID=A0A8H6ZNM2_PLEOS|nr:uncharacterized protein PC9H_010364 [Pleurotus ostreatus]KAF7422208.1 hypothetical protein PC9H_010364 [Pleurotus ostreatus]
MEGRGEDTNALVGDVERSVSLLSSTGTIWIDVYTISFNPGPGGRHPGYGAPSQAIPPQIRRRPLRHRRKTTEDVAARVNLISALLRAVKDDITAFRKSLRVPSPADGGSRVNASSEGPSLGQVSNDIDGAFEEILKRVHEAFPAPDEAAHHAARQRLISHILEGAEIELIKILCAKHNLVGEDALRTFWRGVSPVIESAVVTTGDLAEQHPKLAAFVIAGVIAMLIPESWFAKPLLRLIGFGPVGPAKGSPAAWAQRVFYGANVHTKSVFASLQRVASRL